MMPHRQPGYATLTRLAIAIASTYLAGCNSTPIPPLTPPTHTAIRSGLSTPPPPFHLVHQTTDSLTLVTTETATDDQLAALLYQLHDAASAHSFQKLHLPQAFIDHRDPIIFIHLYRGPKCAAEKYTTAAYPCGPSYHAAADYTLGSFANKDRDAAVLLHPNAPPTELWNPDAPNH
jgi:hypothetical protein